MDNFFSDLRYSVGNEDWAAEASALRLRPEDTVLCITASGDRPLHVMLSGCEKVIAVDANASQNFLLELKLSAIQQFDYHTYLGFLGIEEIEPGQRWQLFSALKPHLSVAAQRYWQQRRAKICKGVIYQGATERATRKLSRIMQIFRRKKLKKLFSFDDIHQQREFLLREWNTPLWRHSLKLALHPRISRLFIKDLGLNSKLDRAFHPGAYIYERLTRAFERDLAKSNMIGSLLFLGELPKEALPPYLTEAGFTAIKASSTEVTSVTDDVISYLQTCPDNSIDAFSMSDIASYMDQDSFAKLCHEIVRTATPDARFSLREFMSSRQVPEQLLPHIQRDADLELECEGRERNFVYRFMAGNIHK